MNQEQHIIHQLLLRSSLGKEVGLYHGKMGLILFFAHYYRHTGQQVYDDIALTDYSLDTDVEGILHYVLANSSYYLLKGEVERYNRACRLLRLHIDRKKFKILFI